MADYDYGALGDPGEAPEPTSPLEDAQRALGLLGARRDLAVSLFRLAVDWLEEEPLLVAALAVLEQTLQAEASSVIMLDRREGDLYFAAATGPVSEELRAVRFDPTEGLAGWCMASGQVVRINHVEAEPQWHGEISQQLGFDVHHILAAPIRVRQRVIGCVEMINKRGLEAAQFSTDDELLLADAGEYLGILFSLRGERPTP